MANTNYQMVATEMRNAMAALPGRVVSELHADAEGWWFTVDHPARADRKGNRLPPFAEKRHIGTTGTLSITKL